MASSIYRVLAGLLAFGPACDPDSGAVAGADPGAEPGKADDNDDVDGDCEVDSPLQHPIVLVHAFHATTTNSWSMSDVAAVLRCEGHFVYEASLPQYAGTPARAEVLVDELDTARERFCKERSPELGDSCFDKTRVHIVGHSQGGLDARYVVGKLGYGPATSSVTTLSAPHRGTPLGDLGLSVLKDPRRKQEHSTILIAAVDDLLTHLLDAVRPDGLADGFYWLSEARFENAQVPGADEHIPDVDTVVYQSWAGVATSNGSLPDVDVCDGKSFFDEGRAAELRGFDDGKTFTLVRRVFDDQHVPNDGHIPVASAKYGEFQGCVPTDHLDLIGRPASQAAENEELAGFSVGGFYRALGESLLEIERRG